VTKSKPADTVEEKLPDGAVRVRLTRPIPFHDEQRHALVFREPTGEDIEHAGCPVEIIPGPTLEADPSVKFDEKKMNAMFARLSDTPLPFIRRMRGADWTNCAWAIAPFFVPGAK
jgi:hypothetical protein